MVSVQEWSLNGSKNGVVTLAPFPCFPFTVRFTFLTIKIAPLVDLGDDGGSAVGKLLEHE
jgi:hypothetical protein